MTLVARNTDNTVPRKLGAILTGCTASADYSLLAIPSITGTVPGLNGTGIQRGTVVMHDVVSKSRFAWRREVKKGASA